MGTQRRVLSLDGLRAISILIVVTAHGGLGNIIPGGFGVTLFFFISGYLITGQLLGEHDRRGRIALGNFYLRRGLRLIPASAAFIIVAGLLYISTGRSITLGAWLSAFFYLANYYYIFYSSTTVDTVSQAFHVLWSLAIEEHFYFFWPCLLIVLLKWKRGPAIAAGAICLGVLLWRFELRHICLAGEGGVCGDVAVWLRIYSGTDTRLDSIMYGAILAIVERGRSGVMPFRPKLVPAGIAFIAILASLVIRDDAFRDTWRYSVQGLALLVIIPAIVHRASLVRDFLEIPFIVWIGRMSYSLYLFHWAALIVADGFFLGSPVRWTAIYVSLSVAFTLSSYYGIERPMIALRRRAGSSETVEIAGPRAMMGEATAAETRA